MDFQKLLRQSTPIWTTLVFFFLGFESGRHMGLGLENCLYLAVVGVMSHGAGLAQITPQVMAKLGVTYGEGRAQAAAMATAKDNPHAKPQTPADILGGTKF
jgi:hypothetical protein